MPPTSFYDDNNNIIATTTTTNNSNNDINNNSINNSIMMMEHPRYYRRHHSPSPDTRLPQPSFRKEYTSDQEDRDGIESDRSSIGGGSHYSNNNNNKNSSSSSNGNHSNIPSRPLKASPFSILSDDILEFQKLVRQLEEIVSYCSVTPQDQWRSRILIGSTEQLSAEIQAKLHRQEMGLKNMAPSVANRHHTAQSKLVRDYNRVQRVFESLRKEYHRKQQSELQQLNVNLDQHKLQNQNQNHQSESPWDEAAMGPLISQREELYSEHVMKERHKELVSINRKTQRVNEIYKDLGAIVSSQQERVDRVENMLNEAQAYTGAGLEESQQANRPYNLFASVSDDDSSIRSDENHKKAERKFRWTLPFETLEEDLREVTRDLEGLGSDLVTSSKAHLKEAAQALFRCAEFTDVSSSRMFD